MNKDYTDLMYLIKKGVGYTHNSTFHADDVLSACLIKLVNPDFNVIRISEIPEDNEYLCFDIGLQKYDHHQKDSRIRPNGIKYAAFGLLFKDLYPYFFDKEHFNLFDKCFIQEIDNCDNTSNNNLLSSTIGTFNKINILDEDNDENFLKAVELFTPILKNLITHYQNSTFVSRHYRFFEPFLNDIFSNIYKKKNVKGLDYFKNNYFELMNDSSFQIFNNTFLSQLNKTYGFYKTNPFIQAFAYNSVKESKKLLKSIVERKIKVLQAMEKTNDIVEKIYNETVDKRIITLGEYLPYDNCLKEKPEPVFVIFKSDRGGYNICSVSMNEKEKLNNGLSLNKNHYRKLFPEYLRGKDKRFLEKEYKGLFFVHPSGFMASCSGIWYANLFAQEMLKK